MCSIVPYKGESTVFGTCPINGDGVDGCEGSKEVLCISAVHILDRKIVHCEAEGNGAGNMPRQPCCVGNRSITIGGKMGN